MQNKYFNNLISLLILALFASSCKDTSYTHSSYSKQKDAQKSIFAIKNVNVIQMTDGSDVLQNATVIIDNGKIVSLNGPIPNNSEIIDGRDKWLLPGLIDMHVHVPTDGHFNKTYPTRTAAIFTNTQDIMTPFVANGVTTIFELIGVGGHFGQRNEIIRGDVIGPRMALAAMINGGDETIGRIMANTPSDGRQSVRMAKAEGYEFIKVYSQLNIDTYKAIVDEANKQALKVIGHIPNAFQGRIEEAFVPNFGMVAHAEEYAKQSKNYSDEDVQHFAKLAIENGTWLSPTLIVIERIAEQTRTLDSVRNLQSFKYVHPLLQSKWLTANKHYQGRSSESVDRMKKMIEFNNRLVKTFKEVGVPIVAGTDAGSSGVVWGFSLHDEIELLVKAGLTPKEALASATTLPAKWLGIDSIVGTIEIGKSADLVLLDGNPLIDIKNTRKISSVFVNGHWLNKSTINIMLSDLSKRNIAIKHKYDWSKRGEY